MRYERETRISAPPAVVFHFHEHPDALTKLIPPWERMRVVSAAGSLRVGSRVVLRGRAWGVPIQWVAVHTEYAPPHLFADRQESGPFANWYHRHLMLDDGRGGTLLRDEVDYELPLALLGGWLAGWLVRRKLERMFAYRHEVTKRALEPRPPA
ncbi:MAG: SRPBCC family protein [Vicinamibacterales bacterium]